MKAGKQWSGGKLEKVGSRLVECFLFNQKYPETEVSVLLLEGMGNTRACVRSFGSLVPLSSVRVSDLRPRIYLTPGQPWLGSQSPAAGSVCLFA